MNGSPWVRRAGVADLLYLGLAVPGSIRTALSSSVSLLAEEKPKCVSGTA
jgi:hypothetical protein